MSKQISVVLLGAGNRANVYASVSLKHPEKLKVVGIVDPDPIRTKIIRDRYNVPEENCFTDVSEFIKRDKFADAVINGTMEHLHVPTSIPVLEKGYDLLLEKPFAVNHDEMEELCRVAKKCNSKVVIGHVLRYTDFYRSIKDVILSGKIGKIKSIETCEHVNFLHMAVAFVRGKWRSEKLCKAPMILAKSCHDIDILLWMMNETKPKSVASFGCDFEFGKDNKPANAGTRCTVDCPIEKECPYSAKAATLTPLGLASTYGNHLKTFKQEANLPTREKSSRYQPITHTENVFGTVSVTATLTIKRLLSTLKTAQLARLPYRAHLQNLKEIFTS